MYALPGKSFFLPGKFFSIINYGRRSVDTYQTIFVVKSSETVIISSFLNSFKTHKYIYFLEAYDKTFKVECLNFVSGYSFHYVSPLN